jgi:uncharacterized protein DUF4956
MPDFLRAPFADGPALDPMGVSIRLLAAAILGGGVAFVYRRTRHPTEVAPTFPVTLVLLSVLIAMSTQVIGSNVARAFSLVGALSIVRFRTVVRDTEDTAFVIFAVVVGMAVGAQDVVVSIAGFAITSLVVFLIRPRLADTTAAAADSFLIHVRVGAGHAVEALIGPVLDAHIAKRQMLSMKTARQGTAVDASFQGQLRPGANVEELVKTLNRLDGVQEVDISRPGRLET